MEVIHEVRENKKVVQQVLGVVAVERAAERFQLAEQVMRCHREALQEVAFQNVTQLVLESTTNTSTVLLRKGQQHGKGFSNQTGFPDFIAYFLSFENGSNAEHQ